MSQLINIFVDPVKAFTALKDKPSFVLPLVLSAVLPILLALVYFSSVDPDWFLDHQLQASGREMTAAQMEQMRANMPSPRILGYFSAVAAPIGVAVFALIFSVYYFLAGKITGQNIRFGQAVGLFAWSGMPVLLGTLVALIGAFSMAPQTSMESLMLTHVDPLLVQLPLDHAASKLAKAFDLLSLWSIGLAALGWKTWTRSGWTQALLVAALPLVVVFGIWSLFVLI